jgi:hypothetical protein
MKLFRANRPPAASDQTPIATVFSVSERISSVNRAL